MSKTEGLNYKITKEERGEVLILHIEGECSHQNYRSFREALESLIQDKKYVILEMSALGIITSAGLGALVRNQKQIMKREGKIVIARATEHFVELARHIQFDKVFPFFDEVEEAEEFFKASP